jgi:hypothetical protein
MTPPLPHYLYLEAVNLGNVIDDTEDLSTRRAGGYMLLELVHMVAAACKTELDGISVGASAGLFKLKDGHSMAAARTKLQTVLKTEPYDQATVLVADTETDRVANSSFKSAREGLLAHVRLQQMQSLGLVTDFGQPAQTPERKSTRQQTRACEIDGVRPAVSEQTYKTRNETRWQSKSVTVRRDEGMTLRRSFYKRELTLQVDEASRPDCAEQGCFTDHFDELTRFDPGYKDHLPTNLEHKLAVLYADGDSFGALAVGCLDEVELEKWDRTVQEARRKFLRALVKFVDTHPFGKTLKEPKVDDKCTLPYRLRVETLMWGGDEFLIVVPAWLALEAAELFFKTCQVIWPAEQKGLVRGHSAALVFAHHKAPIGPLKALASSLAETAKSAKRQAKKRVEAIEDARRKGINAPALLEGPQPNSNSLNWMVLESFDHAGGELDTYWARRDLPSLGWPQMTLNDARLATLRRCFPALVAHLPRRAVHRIVHGLQDWSRLGPENKRLIERAYTNVHEAIYAAGGGADAPDLWAELWQALQPIGSPATLWSGAPSADHNAAQTAAPLADPRHLSAWLTLNELWDYLLPSPQAGASASSTTAPETSPTKSYNAQQLLTNGVAA